MEQPSKFSLQAIEFPNIPVASLDPISFTIAQNSPKTHTTRLAQRATIDIEDGDFLFGLMPRNPSIRTKLKTLAYSWAMHIPFLVFHEHQRPAVKRACLELERPPYSQFREEPVVVSKS